MVAMAWRKAAVRRHEHQDRLQYRWVFVEDEGLMVGRCELPATFFTLMRCAPLVARVSVPMEARVNLLLDEYTSPSAQGEDPERWLSDMMLSMDRLAKKVGTARVDEFKDQLRRKNYEPVVRGLLTHYDRLYDLHATDRACDFTQVGAEQMHHIADVSQASHIKDHIDSVGLARAILDKVTEFDAEA